MSSQRPEGPNVVIAAVLVLFAVASYAVPHLAPEPGAGPTVIATVDVSLPADTTEPTDTADHPADILPPSALTSERPSVSGPEPPVADDAPAPEQSGVMPLTLPEGTIVVAPTGSSDAAGTYEEPLDLATALGEGSAAQPGDTVVLRGGTYHGTFTSELNGTSTEPIVIRSFPGEWAVLDGGSEPSSTLTVNGADTQFVAMEFTKSDPNRRTRIAGSSPADLSRASANGIDVFGTRTKLRDLVVRDHGNGIGFWRRAEDAEIRGAVIFNNGWLGSDRGHGHGVYVQNETGTKRIVDSVIFRNFGWGIHAYGQNGHVNGLVVEGVTSFENGAPAGTRYPNLFAGTSEKPVDRVRIGSNILYHRPSGSGRNLQVGFGSEPNRFAEISNNVVVGGSPAFMAMNFENLDVHGNVFHSQRSSMERRFLVDLQRVPTDPGPLVDPIPAYTWDRNTYVDRSEVESGPFASFLYDAESSDDALTFPQWRDSAGIDARSTYSTDRQTTTDVFIRPTGSGRAIITVLNWTERRSFKLDLKGIGLPIGSAFEIKDAQSFLDDPLVSGTWNGGLVEIPLDSGSVSQPVGSGGPWVDRTPVGFGAFVLMPR